MTEYSQTPGFTDQDRRDAPLQGAVFEIKLDEAALESFERLKRPETRAKRLMGAIAGEVGECEVVCRLGGNKERVYAETFEVQLVGHRAAMKFIHPDKDPHSGMNQSSGALSTSLSSDLATLKQGMDGLAPLLGTVVDEAEMPIAIITGYEEGVDLNEAIRDGVILPEEAEEKLAALLEGFESKGYFLADSARDNVRVRPDSSLVLLDPAAISRQRRFFVDPEDAMRIEYGPAYPGALDIVEDSDGDLLHGAFSNAVLEDVAGFDEARFLQAPPADLQVEGMRPLPAREVASWIIREIQDAQSG